MKEEFYLNSAIYKLIYSDSRPVVVYGWGQIGEVCEE